MSAEERTPDRAASDRKLAHEAIGAAVQSSEARGVGRRAFLLGLWQSAVGVLLATGDTHDVLAFLEDRASSIKGQGRNADAPPLKLDAETAARRAAEASVAAEVIVGHLEPLNDVLDEAGRGETFAPTVADAAFGLLQEAWGPAHLRRALREQIGAIEDGIDAPILPAEPSATNHTPRPAPQPAPRAAPEPEAAAPIPSEPYLAPELPAAQRPRFVPGFGRLVEAHVDAGSLASGHSAFALAMTITDASGSRRELREVLGTVPDPTGRTAILAGCLDLFAGLGDPAEGESVMVTLTSDIVTSGMKDPYCRLASEEPLWLSLMAAERDRAVEWIATKPGIGSDLAQRCDRMLRAAIAEFGGPDAD